MDTSTGGSPLREDEDLVQQAKTPGTPRRELVQVVLRETMRRHGVPSDWIDCRVLPVMHRHEKAAVHVQFLVRKGDQQLLGYLHAFQESFWVEMLKFEPQANDWLLSVAWQFYGSAVRGFAPLPEPGAWTEETRPVPAEAAAAQVQPADAEDLESDLQALYAIRDAAISQPAPIRAVTGGEPS
ncbi:MAG: hypothetical protein H0X13_14680 [Ramlibacter sp.]|nr:hypothetical protein [Ramlibacter sp.]